MDANLREMTLNSSFELGVTNSADHLHGPWFQPSINAPMIALKVLRQFVGQVSPR
jgi:hypothetical protein